MNRINPTGSDGRSNPIRSKLAGSLIAAGTLIAFVAIAPGKDVPVSWDPLDAAFDALSKDSVLDGSETEIVRYTRCQLTPNFYFAKDWKDEEEAEYYKQARAKWLSWWENSGRKIADNRTENAKIRPEGWKFAMKALNGKDHPLPAPPGPVWIPDEWRFDLAFRTGDYGGRFKRRWILEKRNETATLIRIQGSYTGGWGPWEIALETYRNLTPAEADRFLGSLTYIFEYRLDSSVDKPKDRGMGFYYPNGSMRLDAMAEGPVWALHGYDFFKNLEGLRYPVPNTYDPGLDYDVGIARSLLLDAFGDPKRWATVYVPDKKARNLIRNHLHDDFDSIALLSEFGDETDLKAFREATATLEKNRGKLHIPLIDRVSQFQVISNTNACNHLEYNLRRARLPEEKLAAKLAREPVGPDPKTEERPEVDWNAAIRQSEIGPMGEIEVGSRVSTDLNGLVYTWRVATIFWGKDRKTFSSLSLVRESAE